MPRLQIVCIFVFVLISKMWCKIDVLNSETTNVKKYNSLIPQNKINKIQASVRMIIYV